MTEALVSAGFTPEKICTPAAHFSCGDLFGACIEDAQLCCNASGVTVGAVLLCAPVCAAMFRFCLESSVLISPCCVIGGSAWESNPPVPLAEDATALKTLEMPMKTVDPYEKHVTKRVTAISKRGLRLWQSILTTERLCFGILSLRT